MYTTSKVLSVFVVVICVFCSMFNGGYGEKVCSGSCLIKPDHTLMNRVMVLINKTYTKCAAEHECPLAMSAESASSCVNGEAGTSTKFACKNVDVQSIVPLADLGSEKDGNDIWGWTDPDTLKEYAIVGCMDGTSFVDVTNPTQPVVLGFMNSNHPTPAVWRDMKVYNNRVYIVADSSPSHGMQVYDLTQLRNLSGRKPTSIVPANATWQEREAHTRRVARSVPRIEPDRVFTGFGSCHNIVINEDTGFGYAVGSDKCAGGLYVVDLRDEIPTYAGCYSEDGYTHDAQCVIYHGADARYLGKEICFAYNEDTLTIVDVSDKDNMVMISRTSYKRNLYTHQGWLMDNHYHLIMNDELDEVYAGNDQERRTRSLIWNVEDLENPRHIGNFVADEKSIDHNLYVRDDFVYETNYCAGLRILDTAKIAEGKLNEVAYFDVSPECNDKVIFKGSWSSYPYFPSLNIVVNSIERGLFVLRQTNTGKRH